MVRERCGQWIRFWTVFLCWNMKFCSAPYHGKYEDDFVGYFPVSLLWFRMNLANFFLWSMLLIWVFPMLPPLATVGSHCLWLPINLAGYCSLFGLLGFPLFLSFPQPGVLVEFDYWSHVSGFLFSRWTFGEPREETTWGRAMGSIWFHVCYSTSLMFNFFFRLLAEILGLLLLLIQHDIFCILFCDLWLLVALLWAALID